MTGTWDPIPPSLPPIPRPCRFALHPLLLPASPYSRARLTPADAVRWQSRISFSCIVLFPITGRRFATVACISTYLQSPFPLPFFLRRRHPPTRTSTYPTRALSKYYFLHGDKCKTKTYLFYSLCKYAGIATGWPDLFPPLSAFPSVSFYSRLLSRSPSRSYIYSIQRMDTRVSCNWDRLFYFSARDC